MLGITDLLFMTDNLETLVEFFGEDKANGLNTIINRGLMSNLDYDAVEKLFDFTQGSQCKVIIVYRSVLPRLISAANQPIK